MSTHSFDLIFSGFDGGRSSRLVALDPNSMEFVIGRGIRSSNARTLSIRSESIIFSPADGGSDVSITVYIDAPNDPPVVSFQLQHCQSLNWTLDEDVQETVGEGRFNVRLND